MKAFKITITGVFISMLITTVGKSQDKLPAYYGEKLSEIPKEFRGEWILEYHHVPDGQIVTDFFKKMPQAIGKSLTIDSKLAHFGDEKCDIKRIHRTNPKISFFDVLVNPLDGRDYPHYFQNNFLKNGCQKNGTEPYSYAQLKKAAETGIILDCKNDTLFIPTDLILLSSHEMFSSLEDYFVCFRRKGPK